MAEPIIATARAGETLSALVARTVGRTAGVVEKVLAANPGAGALTRLPQGYAITIPTQALAAPAVQLIDLWD